MSLAYIRGYYRVPAKRGGRVEYNSPQGVNWLGTITGANGPYLRVRIDGRKFSANYHPTDRMRYLEAAPKGEEPKA